MATFDIVVAYDLSGGIGIENQLPWNIKKDKAWFCAKINHDNVTVIVGRVTYATIAHVKKFRNCQFIVLSSNSCNLFSSIHKVITATSLDDALSKATTKQILVIGGSVLYKEAVRHAKCLRVLVTVVEKDYACDCFFPTEELEDGGNWELVYRGRTRFENPTSFHTREYVKKSEEHQYLNLMRNIMSQGNVREERTGTGARSLFGKRLKFSLRDNKIPLLTTKRVFWRGVVEELLWFVSGSTNAKKLSDKGITIWDGNSSREYLDSVNLKDREEGDLGPVYGHNWRFFGAEYVDMHTDYTGKGVDQLLDCIDKIKNDPTNRRILMSAWDPSSLHQVALPPCHILCQFFCCEGELHCQVYQRSCDTFLGQSFNIASYSLLTIMVAHICGLKAGTFVHVLGDTHLYNNHIVQAREQISREPREFPTLIINRKVESVDGFMFEDFVLSGYNPHPTIQAPMAI